MRELRAALGIPDTLAAFGVPRTGFDAIRDMSLSDPTAGGNPIELTAELAARMLDAAFGK